jgi:hypothetical protein
MNLRVHTKGGKRDEFAVLRDEWNSLGIVFYVIEFILLSVPPVASPLVFFINPMDPADGK